METYTQKISDLFKEVKESLPPEVKVEVEAALEALKPRSLPPLRAVQATENLKKYGLELPDSELLQELFWIAHEAVATMEVGGYLDCMPDKVKDWYKLAQAIDKGRREALRIKALSKLTPEEREVLGLNQEEDF